MPSTLPRPLLGAAHPLDIRAWPRLEGGDRRRVQGMPASPEGPLLLVGVSRRMGGAVLRNRFKRRVRMAFLSELRERQPSDLPPLVLFVRPGRSVPKGQDISYGDILRALRLALGRV